VRSSGLEYETVLKLKGLPILGKAIINFHDPYPLFFLTRVVLMCLQKKHLLEFKEMYEIVKKRTDVPHLQIYFQRICS
jgi:hypothetical protein